MSPEVLAALVAGGLALLLALLNLVLGLRQGRELEKLKSQLVIEQARDKARLDYEYEARRRLHATTGPALFQIMELAEFSLETIGSLTDPNVWEELAKTESHPPASIRPSLPQPKYETIAALYGLYAPLVVVRGLARSLSQLDLSLEPLIELQYYLCTRVYGSFKDDVLLAAASPAVSYKPFAPGWRELRLTEPEKYWWQGLTMGRLEGMLDLMTVEVPKAPARVASFGEFERTYIEIFDDATEERRKAAAAGANALHLFRPSDRPVFWRMMIAQARIYQSLLRTRTANFEVPRSTEEWDALMRLDRPEDFKWRSAGNDGASLEETLAVTGTYLRAKVIDPWDRQHPAMSKARVPNSPGIGHLIRLVVGRVTHR